MNIMSTTTKRAGLMSCLIFPQNGVVGGHHHYGTPDDSTSIETPKRPKNLGVAAASLNGYVAKNSLREEREDADDGSLPCTPEIQSDSELDAAPSSSAASSLSPSAEALDSDTRQLLALFFAQFAGLSKAQRGDSKALTTMWRVVEDILAKHQYAYNGMINKLSVEEREGDMSFLESVARSLFSDGTTNWGRIASLVSFGAVVCQHMKEQGRTNCVDMVAEQISTYLLHEQREWLIKNNSWDGFVDFFKVADPESAVRSTLMAVAGVAGIGATLAMLIR
ncbi:unnamed protein product [Ophioblennius macclurei]